MKLRFSLLFLFITFSLVSVSGQSFSFFEKAKTHYIKEKSKIPADSLGETRLDSLINLPSAATNEVSAYGASWQIGLGLLKQGKHPLALDIFDEMRRYLEAKPTKTHDDLIRLSSVYNIIGAIYEETGLWNEALDHYMHSLQICDDNNYLPGKAKVFNNIAKLYFNRDELTKAEDLFLKAIEINKKLDIRPELFNNYINLAGVYQLRHNYKKALEFALIALNQLDINKDAYDLSILYSNIGILYQDMGNYAVALSYFEQAAEIGISKSYESVIIEPYLSIATVYQIMGKNDSSNVYIAKALKLATKLGNPSEKMKVFMRAAAYYKSTGNYLQSSNYYEKYLKLNDSLETLNNLTKIEQIQAVYEVLSTEKDNKILQQTINLQKLAIQRQRIILFGGLILFLFLVYFVLNIQRNRKRERSNNDYVNRQTELFHQKEKEMMLSKERNLELELEFKKKELTLNVMSLMKLNEMLSEISEKIIQSGKTAQHQETRDVLKKIGKEVQKSTEAETLKEFSLRFKEVNADFFDALLAKYPDLTPSELRLSAFLKLNLSTKEISELTGQRLKALEIARYRLRQKLGIANSDINLVSFMTQI